VIAAMTLLFVLAIRELGSSLFLYTSDTMVMAVLLLDYSRAAMSASRRRSAWCNRAARRADRFRAFLFARRHRQLRRRARRLDHKKRLKEKRMSNLRINRRQFTAGAAAGLAAAASAASAPMRRPMAA